MSTVVRAILVAGFIFTQISVILAEDEPVPLGTDPTAIQSDASENSTPAEPSTIDATEPDVGSSLPEDTLMQTYEQQTQLPLQGRAMYYNPGIMETVLGNRLHYGMVDVCAECIGYVAMLRVGDLNRRVWIQLPDATVHGPFHVIDAADVRHIPMLIEKGWAVDVDYETARRWGMRNPWTVTLLSEPPVNIKPAVLVIESPQFQIDIYRNEKLNYNNLSAAYFGHIDELYVR